MEGYDVITFDDAKIGHLVGREGPFLVVEHGSIFKHRRPVPAAFATVDDDARVVRLTVSREILESAPEVGDGGLDERAAAEHYGLAAGFEAPETLGEGRIEPGDPAIGAEQADEDLGLVPPSHQRAVTQNHLGPGQGPNDRGVPSPGITGGDRFRDH
jgi:hypothetical protein